MNKKKKLKIRPLLITLNILVLFCIVGYYLFRMVYYYLDENGDKIDNSLSTLSDTVIKKREYVDLEEGLIFDEEDNVYRYKGAVKDNYLYYSGIMFRIVGVDNGNNVRAITDKNLTLMYSGLEKGYEESYINKWLNTSEDENSGVFEKNLYNADELITSALTCGDEIDDLTKITCDTLDQKYNISLLSLYDYSEAGGKTSYLNNGQIFYLSTNSSQKGNYFINLEGDVGLNKITTKIYGVRPLITIPSTAVLIGGTGSEKDPYIIEKHDVKKLSDTYTGSIVKYSGMNWKVTSIGDNVILALNSKLKVDDKEVTRKFEGTTSKYTITAGIGKYLNTTFYATLENPEYIVKHKWNVGQNLLSNLDYAETYSAYMNNYVGMPALSDFFVNDIDSVFTISRGIESNSIINVIDENKNAFGDLITSKYNIRPTICMNGEVSIVSGKGTEEDPYVLGGLNAKEE